MDKRFIGIKETAEYLGVEISTLYSWTYQKKIPYSKMGKLVKFDLRELEIWLKQKTIKPIRWD
jgi:excisionase family DNA binding protein